MRLDPYGPAARWYDVVSGERPVHRAGRLAGLRLLRLRRGDAVLDLGCGTGLDLPLLAHAVGPKGLLVGLDRSPDMLAVARCRPGRGWPPVRFVQADATAFDDEALRALLRDEHRSGFDALVATYALSVVGGPTAAWQRAVPLLRAGGRAAIVDTRIPRDPLRPPAALAMRLGGVDPEARPWRLLAAAPDVRTPVLRAGHVVATAATVA